MQYQLSLSLLLLLSSFPAAGQGTEKKVIDLRIGVGFYSHPFFNEARFNQNSPFEFITIFGKPGIQGTGVLNVSASIDLNNKMQAGLSLLHQRIYVNYSVFDIPYRLANFALLPNLNYTFLRSEKTSLYSGLATGPAILHRKILEQGHNEKKLAYQATFFGVRSGKKYASVLELGYGYKGIVNWLFSMKL